MKVIAFYLPQYHEIPENNEWWGKGFTEWVNVKNCTPLFEGHDQPKRPLNNNYYDLLDDNVKKWQINLAKENGVDGFCFYHYWFDGKLMLEKPLEQYLNNKELDFPFCFCWANPVWTKIWAGKASEILINQRYGNEIDWEKHFQYLLPFFKDERYIKEDGMPLFVIYSPMEIGCLKEMLLFFRKRIKEEGFPGIKICYQYYVNKKDTKKILPLFDYSIRFQPVYALTEMENNNIFIKFLKKINNIYMKLFKKSLSDKMVKLRISDYDKVWEKILSEKPNDKYIYGSFVAWDNTPRRGKAGRLIVGSSPEKFELYLKKLIDKSNNESKNKYLFITAWNEWSEGSYLEPDETNKDGYLKAIKRARINGNN